MRSSAKLNLGVLLSLVVHGVVAGALWTVDPATLSARKPEVVELEVRELPPPPPPEPVPPPPEQPKPEPPPPRPRRVAVKPPPKPVETPPLPPPPPNQEPPPEPPKEPPPPVFGVTLDSVVGGESPVAVPVGNTMMTKERKPAPTTAPPPAPLPAAPLADAFSPVSDLYISKHPGVVKEVRADYPEEARRLGVEGMVMLKVGVDRTGKVRSVTVVRKVGHGLDEAARKALWQFKFSPAVANDGKAVDYILTYKYTFRADR